MSIFVIGDLHLSGNPPKKPMEIFGQHWKNHWNKIKENWIKSVNKNDTVIICGDISWAIDLKEALEDLNEIAQLPGKKVLLRGNHDYWWVTLKKMREETKESFEFLQNNFIQINNTAICGTRGWKLPSDEYFTIKDEKIYLREELRFENSLKSAKDKGFDDIIAVLHYPPLTENNLNTKFTHLCEKYKVKICVYGHVHGEDITNAFNGLHNNINYKLTSCDGLNFELFKIQ
jgi:predicted phosphohydrolase